MTILMELEEAKKETKVELCEVGGEIFHSIKKNISDNLGIIINDSSYFIWEHFPESSNISGEFVWEYIADFIPEEECYLFFNQIECKKAYLFKNGRDLCKVIAETYNCEVYVTDYSGTYVMCYNHEMILSGCGRAKPWIDELNNNE